MKSIYANLYQWVFHFNPNTETWSGIHREDYREYFNGAETKHPVFTQTNIESVIIKIDEYVSQS